jgi:hypothetical protein
MGQAGAVVIPLVVDKHLGLVFKSAECGTMYDPVPVTLEGRSLVTVLLREASPSRLVATGSVSREMHTFTWAGNHDGLLLKK